MMIMGTNIDLCLGSPDSLLEVHPIHFLRFTRFTSCGSPDSLLEVHLIHFLWFRNKVVGSSLFSALSIEQLSLRDNHGNRH